MASMSRRSFLQLFGASAAAVAGLGLVGCGGSSNSGSSDSKVETIKSRGKLKCGVKKDVVGYGLLNTSTNTYEGMEIDLCYQVAAKVFGCSYDEAKSKDLCEFTDVTPKTRGPLIDNDQLDLICATYTITDDRKKVISFAGPYYTTQQSILTMADKKDIKSVDDLAGKTVAVQSGSTGPKIVADVAPDATLQEFKTDEEARKALEQGRVDAYVIDTTMQMGTMVRNPNKYRLAGDPFGPEDKYGIGLPKDSDGVQFVNDFLQKIEDDGTWANLWKICIGDRADIADAPNPPALEA